MGNRRRRKLYVRRVVGGHPGPTVYGFVRAAYVVATKRARPVTFTFKSGKAWFKAAGVPTSRCPT